MSVFEEQHGDVAERPNAPVLKTGEVIPPRVQIPPSPQHVKALVVIHRGFSLSVLVNTGDIVTL